MSHGSCGDESGGSAGPLILIRNLLGTGQGLAGEPLRNGWSYLDHGQFAPIYHGTPPHSPNLSHLPSSPMNPPPPLQYNNNTHRG